MFEGLVINKAPNMRFMFDALLLLNKKLFKSRMSNS